MRESKHASASISAAEQENAAERAALDSRCDRLARELEDAMVKVEVLSAKGAMYDEVAAGLSPSFLFTFTLITLALTRLFFTSVLSFTANKNAPRVHLG